MNIKKSPNHKKYTPDVNAVFFRFKIEEQARKSSYRIDGEKYILVYNQNKLNVYLNMKDKFDDTFEFMSDLMVSNYQEGEFDFGRSKRYKERSQFSAGTHFTEAYWKTQNVFYLPKKNKKYWKH
ncbi:hypothetical protein [Flavobacterium suncheonense]|uniref:hypothetical protein n=1 Tax=Flavobacterium suncheonense TaxID=350894 RepID=UPI003FA3A865